MTKTSEWLIVAEQVLNLLIGSLDIICNLGFGICFLPVHPGWYKKIDTVAIS
jgi:hypothetical protein